MHKTGFSLRRACAVLVFLHLKPVQWEACLTLPVAFRSRTSISANIPETLAKAALSVPVALSGATQM